MDVREAEIVPVLVGELFAVGEPEFVVVEVRDELTE